jgi:hypothetical protein
LFSLLAISSVSAKEWRFGLGTGFTLLNAQGDQGLTTNNFGSIQAEMEWTQVTFRTLWNQ